MAEELRCTGCGGPLAWAGSQVSCHGCGKVHTLSGKPGSKLAMLLVGVCIGSILGFIAAYELNRFVLDSDSAAVVVSENVAKEESVGTPSKSPTALFVDPDEYAALVTGKRPEASGESVQAEAVRLRVDLEIHSTRKSGDHIWVYGRATNRSLETLGTVKVFAILKNGDGTVAKQDYFFALGLVRCLAPGESVWFRGLVDDMGEGELVYEASSDPAYSCGHPIEGLTIEQGERLDEHGDRVVFGQVQNDGKRAVRNALVTVHHFEEGSGKLIGKEDAYLSRTLQPGEAQRFVVESFEGPGRLELEITGTVMQ